MEDAFNLERARAQTAQTRIFFVFFRYQYIIRIESYFQAYRLSCSFHRDHETRGGIYLQRGNRDWHYNCYFAAFNSLPSDLPSRLYTHFNYENTTWSCHSRTKIYSYSTLCLSCSQNSDGMRWSSYSRWFSSSLRASRESKEKEAAFC